MLLAELYLNAGVYTGTPAYAQALTAAQAVISSGAYSLDPNFRHMFQADNNTSPEIIFAITQDGLHTQTYGGVNFIIHASCGNSLGNSVMGVDGCWYGNRLKPQAYQRYDATNDKRASFIFTQDQTLAVASISDFGAGYLAPKFQNVTSTGKPGSNPGFVDTDFPVFRLGEAYLIYAEAAVRGGGGSLTQALTYVNALRQRAYGNTSGNITAGQLNTQFILDERGRELLWEAHRRTDLVRFGLFTGGKLHLVVEGRHRGRRVDRCSPEPLPNPGHGARGEPEAQAESGLLRAAQRSARSISRPAANPEAADWLLVRWAQT